MAFDVKICGLKTALAVDAAVRHGASHVGFIFFPKSPRHITPEEAAKLRSLVPVSVKVVAVTVDADDKTLDHIIDTLNPDILQLHGSETPERVIAIKQRYHLPLIKAFAIRESGDFAAIAAYRGLVDRFLFDAKPPKGADLPGGNGISFDWNLLKALDPELDYMLSGGLNAQNIADALKQTNALAIDVSSGVEAAPGVKDLEKIAAFFREVDKALNARRSA